MPSNFQMKIPALVAKNKGSGVLRFYEVDDLGVQLVNTVVGVFGDLGGIVYEAPFIKKSSTSHKAPLNKENDETGIVIAQTIGDIERMESFDFMGNFEQIIYDAKASVSITAASKTAGVCTLTCVSHSYVVGDIVYVNLTTLGTHYNGSHVVTAITGTTIVYNFGTSTAGTATGTVGSFTISSATKVAGLCTITTSAAHGFILGQTVRVNATTGTPSDYNGLHTLTAVTSTTFSYYYGTNTGATTTGTCVGAFKMSLESLLLSAEKGRQFKLIYYAPVKTIKAATDVGYIKYIYHIGKFNNEYVDNRESGTGKIFSGSYTPEVLPTAPVDPTLGQLGIKILVPSIQAVGLESGELQTQSMT